jgi:hypothetical protein
LFQLVWVRGVEVKSLIGHTVLTGSAVYSLLKIFSSWMDVAMALYVVPNVMPNKMSNKKSLVGPIARRNIAPRCWRPLQHSNPI